MITKTVTHVAREISKQEVAVRKEGLHWKLLAWGFPTEDVRQSGEVYTKNPKGKYFPAVQAERTNERG